MAKNINHHLYQDKVSGVWYFQKKVRGRKKPYKLSLGTKSVLEARQKRNDYLRQIEQKVISKQSRWLKLRRRRYLVKLPSSGLKSRRLKLLKPRLRTTVKF